ncbi:AAA family ATPase [Anatilimnocola sp. NA78]|uniref:AAA family ATPase n=1 Tax=Anatilimnocola sp. NA78 TaxID=3415683 RepID=UPI003CE502D1
MTKTNDNNLMALLGKKAGGTDTWTALAAKTPQHDPAESRSPEQDAKLAQLLQRINHLTTTDPKKTSAPSPAAPKPALPDLGAPPTATPVDAVVEDEFLPIEPPTIRDAGLTESEVEALVLKFLLARGDLTGREMADQVRMPFVLVDALLRALKQDQLLIYRSSAPMNDYVYQLTDLGRERARRYMEHCTYFGSAPVSLMDYILGITAQSLTKQHPSQDDLNRAFSDILVNPNMLRRLGPAINSGRGLFLYGSAGNGKTTIAERVTRAFGQYIWIPRAIGIDGEIIRLFDPVNHEECPLPQNTGLLDQSRLDRRWVRIRRPTIVVGGELTMDSLEVTLNRSTGISEAPLQLKSNCGTLVIDDFGRQKMSTDQLLNRWIVPLEKRYDYLNLPNGKKIQVPFDQLIVFSTNLEPKDLVDEAFLRRIPYKIEVLNPSEEEFRKLFEMMCPKLGFTFSTPPIDHLIEKHYRAVNRPFRACQPRDLLLQVKNFCLYQKQQPELTAEFLDLAVENYFAVM